MVMKKANLKLDFGRTISGEVLNVLGRCPGECPVQLHRRPRGYRIPTVRNIRSQSYVAHQRRDQHVYGRAVARREAVDCVRGEQHGWFGGVGIGIRKVSGNNLCNKKYLKNTNLKLHLISADFQKLSSAGFGTVKIF